MSEVKTNLKVLTREEFLLVRSHFINIFNDLSGYIKEQIYVKGKISFYLETYISSPILITLQVNYKKVYTRLKNEKEDNTLISQYSLREIIGKPIKIYNRLTVNDFKLVNRVRFGIHKNMMEAQLWSNTADSIIINAGKKQVAEKMYQNIYNKNNISND